MLVISNNKAYHSKLIFIITKVIGPWRPCNWAALDDNNDLKIRFEFSRWKAGPTFVKLRVRVRSGSTSKLDPEVGFVMS